MSEVMELDEYELRLKSATKELKECQQNHDTKSCLNCEKLLDCEIRREYVDSVYASMSKGQSGGFEF